jgi:hypothetical protein
MGNEYARLQAYCFLQKFLIAFIELLTNNEILVQVMTQHSVVQRRGFPTAE